MRETVKLLCLIAVTAFACLVLWDADSFLRDTHAHAILTLEHVDRNLIVLGVTLSEVQKGAKEWQTASKSQAAQVTQAMARISSTAEAFGDLTHNADQSLNGQLFPAVTKALNEQSDTLLANQADLQRALRAASATISDLDAQLTDPSIKTSLANIADSTKQINGVSLDAKLAADLALQKEREILNPPPKKLAIKLLEFFGGRVVDGTEMWYYLSH